RPAARLALARWRDGCDHRLHGHDRRSADRDPGDLGPDHLRPVRRRHRDRPLRLVRRLARGRLVAAGRRPRAARGGRSAGPAAMTRLYRNAWVVTMDDAGSEHEDGWLVV